MNLHWIAFTVATLTGVTASVLYWISKCVESVDARLQLSIAATSLMVMTLPLWNVVQALILFVIVRYGKPLEADAKKLIANKLAI